jgi:hexosaminidase
MKLLLISLFLVLTQISAWADNAGIIPRPLSVVKSEGCFTIDESTSLVFNKKLDKAASYLLDYLPLQTKKGKKNNSIRLTLDKKMAKEEYSLRIHSRGIEIRGGEYAGVFNGIQSLLQLLPAEVYAKKLTYPVEVPLVDIKDAPQYTYRGLLLDVARTFQPVEEVKRVIDYMTYCKLNKLHFHLVDSEGWRLELKKYPHIAEKAGFRGGDSPLHPIYGSFDQKYGGYYTQEELRDIVAYASQRNIEVIPEVDMPGHSKALGMVHPDILCNYTPDTSHTNGIDVRDVWCASKESNYQLVEDIVKELVNIFPSEYIHIGGDEVNFKWWKECPDCQQLKQEKGLENEAQVEQYFINRVSDILTRYNRKAMVWDEAVDGGLLPTTTMVTGWRGVKQCLQATGQGYPTIIMPSSVFYLDKRQYPHDKGHNSRNGLSLQTICDFTFEDAGFSDAQRQNIAGIEGAFWTEIYLSNIHPEGRFSDYLEYMLFPRLFGVSEIAWGQSRRSYNEMLALLENSFYAKLDAMNAAYRLSSPIVKLEGGKIHASTTDGSTIYYKDIRTDETKEYTSPLDASLATYVSFQSRMNNGRSSEIALPEYYQYMKPECTVTSSLPFRENKPLERCATYKGDAATTRAAKAGDWVEFTFKEPLKASYIKVTMGYKHLYRRLIYKGHVEVSYDGQNFVRLGNLLNGLFVLHPQEDVYALRVVSDGISDAEEYVIIQPLEIK